MNFSNVVGQQPAKNGLLSMCSGNSLPHALLFTGAEGTGGLPLAIALAQYIFCENRTDTDSCGVCAGCSKVKRMEHADLHFSFPALPPKTNTKALSRYYLQEFREFIKQTPYGTTFDWLQFINAENKQGNIPAEECREIIEKLYLKSYEGGKKVQIMWRPEYLGKEGNILLKLIEEPPADTIMIFVAENKEEILPTILSRTQEIRLAPIPAADITQALIDRTGASPAVAAQVAHLAMGSYTEALRLRQHADNELFPEVRQMFLTLFVPNDGLGRAAIAEKWGKAGREQQKNFLQYVIQLMGHALRAHYLPVETLPLQDAEADFARKFVKQGLPVETIREMMDTISQTIYYIERNAHSKTQLMAMMVRLHYVVTRRQVPVK